jgi:hypothetical protein
VRGKRPGAGHPRRLALWPGGRLRAAAGEAGLERAQVDQIDIIVGIVVERVQASRRIRWGTAWPGQASGEDRLISAVAVAIAIGISHAAIGDRESRDWLTGDFLQIVKLQGVGIDGDGMRNAAAESCNGTHLDPLVSGLVRVAIEDTGAGMSRAVQRRAFDPFFTTRGRAGGTGLGLSISHGIIEDHDGSIEIDSTEGSGTAVTVTLPNTVVKGRD